MWQSKGIWCINDVLKNGRPSDSNTFQIAYGIQHAQKLLDKLYSYIPADFTQHISASHVVSKPVGLYIKDVRNVMTDIVRISTKKFLSDYHQRHED